MTEPTAGGLPWAAPRRELLLLVLVAIAALTPLAIVTPQDQSRFCLSEALLHGRVSNDSCLASSFDKASYHGHLYSDKAPGLSFAATIPVLLLRPGPPSSWSNGDLRLWGVRVLTVGVAFLLCAFMVGRVGEGLAAGFGGAVLVTFALGTLVAPFAAVGYEHVPAAAIAFAAFLLAWSRRPWLAGLLAGLSVVFEYQAALVVLVLTAYMAFRGLRALGRFLAGAVPGLAILAAYDWAAFGAPWRLSYRYVANSLSGEQAAGFFGIGRPHLFGIAEVFTGSRGLLVLSPVIVLAAAGLVRLGRNFRPEAVVAGAVAALVLVVSVGYFDPYGGSQGPRFALMALPFLGLGLGPAFAWLPRLTSVAAVVSVATTTTLSLVWSKVYFPGAVDGVSGGPLGVLVRLPVRIGSQFASQLSPNAFRSFGVGAGAGAAVVALAALAALAVGLLEIPWASVRARRRESRRKPPVWAFVGAVALGYLVVSADVFALANYPYGANPQIELVRLGTSLTGSPSTSYVGGDVNLVASVTDHGSVGVGALVLTVDLSPGLKLVGPPALNRGTGCTGTAPVVCDLGFLRPRGQQVATVSFGVNVTESGDQRVSAVASSPGQPSSKVASVVIPVASH